MSDDQSPQIYLITPPEFELSTFTPRLSAVLDTHEIACLRLSMATKEEDRVARAADALRELAHARDIPLVIEAHVQLVERLGLDGVHLLNGARNLRNIRKDLGADAIIGADCGNSRHDGLNAGEAGADYVSFGPVRETALGTNAPAEHDLFAWWSEVIEVPVVAEGALDVQSIAAFAPVTDFFAIGEEIWSTEDAAATLGTLIAAIG